MYQYQSRFLVVDCDTEADGAGWSLGVKKKTFCWVIYLDFFLSAFFNEPVATEHQSHLLVLEEVLLRIK